MSNVTFFFSFFFFFFFLKKWRFHQYIFQTAFPNFCGNRVVSIANTVTLSNIHVCFMVLNLGTTDRFQKGDNLSSSCCHAVLHTTFRFLIGVRVYSVYGKTFGSVVETLAELHSCVLEISPFFALLYTFCVTRGHDMSPNFTSSQ